MWKLFALALVVSAVMMSRAAPAQDEVSLTGPDGLRAYVTKKAAVIRLYRVLSNYNNTQTGEVSVFMDKIEEKDSAGNKIKGNHAINSFANLDFTVVTANDVYIPQIQPSNVTANCLTCTASLTKVGAGGTMTIGVCAITSNGTLVTGNDNASVQAGQLKITVEIDSWPFADVSNMLDVSVVIKVPPYRSVSKNDSSDGRHGRPVKFSLGGDSFIDFTTQYYRDTAWETMQVNYPLYTSRGANNEFTLRFAHFTTKAVYDPTVEAGYTPASGTDSAAAVAVVRSSLICISILFSVGKLLLF